MFINIMVLSIIIGGEFYGADEQDGFGRRRAADDGAPGGDVFTDMFSEFPAPRPSDREPERATAIIQHGKASHLPHVYIDFCTGWMGL